VPLLIINHFTFSFISNTEKEALIDLYKHTDGANWTMSWDLSKPVSTWHGVRIENNTVTSITLFNNNLRGNLPNSIGKLKNLKVLNMAFNFIEGTIPEEITYLNKLVVLT